MIDKSQIIRGLIVVGPLFALGIFFLVRDQNRKLEEYPLVMRRDSLEGTIADVEVSKSICRVQLESEKKYTIPFARNYGYSPYDLNRFLRKGDAIEKRTGTDTLTVIRDDQVFVFLLDKVLGDNEVSDVIEPLFDIEIEQLLATYKEKCKAQSVRLSRPYVTSNGVTRYWLGIVFTDTELPKSDLNSFAREIGKDFFDHLKNKEAFDMLEIIVKEESGFIITFTETKSIRFTEILFRMFIHQMCHL